MLAHTLCFTKQPCRKRRAKRRAKREAEKLALSCSVHLIEPVTMTELKIGEGVSGEYAIMAERLN